MRILVLAVVLLASASAHASGPKLVAKCGFPEDNLSDVIRPGTPFLYVFEDAGGLSVVNSIATKAERISERVAGLAGDIAPVRAVGRVGGGVQWSQPDLTGATPPQENFMNLGGQPGTLFSTSGTSSYTSAAYPKCMIFED
jgi:hypothetical protein